MKILAYRNNSFRYFVKLNVLMLRFYCDGKLWSMQFLDSWTIFLVFFVFFLTFCLQLMWSCCFGIIINSLETHKTCHSIITWTCKSEISHPKSSWDEDSDHKSRRETVRGDVPCFAFPWTSFERKKSLSLISWYGYNRKPRGMNMNLKAQERRALASSPVASNLLSIKGGKD